MASNPKAEVEITAHSRGLLSRLREARAKFGTFGAELKKNVFGKDLAGGMWGKAGAHMLGNLGASVAGSVAGLIADQAQSVMAYNDGLVRLQINGSATAEEMQDLDHKIRAVSDSTGISKASILGAARSYVALTGDLAGASNSIEAWTKAAQASGSAVSDIASTAQALRDNLKLKPEEMGAAFDILIGQGKKGAVEMSELSNQLAIVSPLMAEFGGGKSLQGMTDLGAAIQIVRKGFGGTEETITGVQSLMTALIKNAGRFQKAGVHVMNVDPKTGTKTLKSFREIIDAISTSKLMKDPEKLEKAFGRVEAFRAFLQLKNNKEEMDQLADATAYAGTTQKDLATYGASAGGRLSIAYEKMKNAIADAFTPERIEGFVAAVERLLPMLNKMIGFIFDAAGALDHFINGPSKEAGSNIAAQDFIQQSNNGTDDGDRNAVARAKHVMEATDAEDLAAKRFAYEAKYGGAAAQAEFGEKAENGGKYGGFEAYRAGAKTFLKSNGGRDEAYATDENNTQASTIRRFAAAGQQMTPKNIAYELARALAPLINKSPPVVVKVDGDAVVKAHRNAAGHARRPGG